MLDLTDDVKPEVFILLDVFNVTILRTNCERKSTNKYLYGQIFLHFFAEIKQFFYVLENIVNLIRNIDNRFCVFLFIYGTYSAI